MTKLDICIFYSGCQKTDIVAPKSKYPTAEAFLEEAKGELEHLQDNEEIWGRLTVDNVKEAFCRFYPVAPEGCDDFPRGCVIALAKRARAHLRFGV